MALLEKFEFFQDSKMYLLIYQCKRVEGKRIFPSFLSLHPPTALRRVSMKRVSLNAEYVMRE